MKVFLVASQIFTAFIAMSFANYVSNKRLHNVQHVIAEKFNRAGPFHIALHQLPERNWNAPRRMAYF